MCQLRQESTTPRQILSQVRSSGRRKTGSQDLFPLQCRKSAGFGILQSMRGKALGLMIDDCRLMIVGLETGYWMLDAGCKM